MDQSETKNLEIIGAKGKGGGGRVAQEGPNTLSSRAIVKIIEVISEGEIEGIAGGGQGIYINDTPLQNADLSYNFQRASWDYRVGLPSQEHMAGFPAVEAEINIGTTVTVASPITRTVTATDIDAVRVTVQLAQGLSSQDMSTGDLNGTSVQFAIDHKLTSSGTWVQAGIYTIEGKTTTPFERQYRIERAGTTGTWDIRVRRITDDSASAALRNQIVFSRITEIQDIKLEYNDTAYVGMAVDAESVGNQIPRRAYLVKGLKVKVPSNYNPVTRVYTGIWNGTFNVAWTDNPAWVLYDILTHSRYGLGEFITEAQVDKWSFYDAAVYNDGLVDNGKGGTEPRFTFNGVLASREEAFRLLSAVAGSMRGSLIYINGQIKVLQDRPADPVKLVTKANVIGGKFDYRSSGLFERHTAFNITWNDREDRHLPRVTTIDASNAPSAYTSMLTAAETRYGYNPVDISAFGSTTEGQAMRHALWALDTELNQTEIVQFKMSFNGLDLYPGDIVKVWDEDYTGAAAAGRIVSVVGTVVTVDRPVTLTAGSKLDVVLADGRTIEQRNIVETTGTLTTFNIDSALSQSVLEAADYMVTTTVSPRQFRILSLKQEEANIISIEAVYHDPNKYSRVESNIDVPAPVFTTVKPIRTNAPTSLSFREITINNADEGLNGVRRSLLLSWVAPSEGIVRNYVIRYRLSSSDWTEVTSLGPTYEINPAFSGTYAVEVYAVSTSGINGPAVSGSYTIQTAGGGASTLNAPTTLQILGGGTSFGGSDINFSWVNPASNATVLTSTLRDFEVRFIETTGSTTVRTIYVPAVAASQTQTASYTFSMNTADGGPRRTVQVQVRCRDTANNLSSPVTATFTNPAPATVAGISVVGGIGNIKLTWTKPTDSDYVGVMVWRSTTTGFTPSGANLVYDTTANYISDAVDFGTTYYYKIAAYDQFSRPTDGTGLNISAQQSGAAVAGEGIPEVGTLPDPSGYTGPKIVFLTTDGQLYSYIDGAWEPTIPPTSDVLDGSITIAKFAAGLKPVEVVASLPTTGNTEGRMVYLTSDNKLYRYDGSAFISTVPSTDISGTLTNSQIADIAAAKITGTLVSSQIADAAITTAKFASGIEPVEILGTLPVSGNFQGRMVFLTTDNKLYRYNGSAFVASVPSTDITGTLSDSQLAAIAAAKITGTLASSQIADAAITTAKFASGLKPVEVVASLPGTPHVEGRMVYLTTDDKLYRNTGSGWVASVAATDVTGTLTNSQIADIAAAKITGTIVASQIADASITTAKFASGIEPVEVVASLPTTGNFEGRIAYLTTDNKLYRHDGTNWLSSVPATDVTGTLTNSQIADVAAAKITGTVVASQIADAAITTSKLASGVKAIEVLAALPGTPHVEGRMVFLTTDDKLYRNTGSGWVSTIPATDVTGQLSDSQLAAISAAKLTGTITTTQITDDAITTAKIAASAVTANEIAANTITAAKIASGTITSTQIAADTITASNIAANAITSSELAANAVIAGKIQAGAITATDIASSTITVDKLLVSNFSNLVDNQNFEGGATAWTNPSYIINDPANAYNGSWVMTRVQASAAAAVISLSNKITAAEGEAYRLSGWLKTASGAVGDFSWRIRWYNAANAVLRQDALTWTGENLTWTQKTGTYVAPAGTTYLYVSAYTVGTGTIYWDEASLTRASDSSLIVDGAITADKITANAITSAKIAADAITTDKIAANAITATEIATDAITTDKIAANAITSSELAANSVIAGKIQAGAITATEIAANAITTDKLVVAAGNLIPNSDFATGDLTNWRPYSTAGSISVLLGSDVSVPVGAPTRYVARYQYTGAAASVSVFTHTKAYADAGSSEDGFIVAEGEQYAVSLSAAKSADYAGTMTVRAYFYKNDNTWTTGSIQMIAPALTTSWAPYSGSFTVPTGMIRCWLYVLSSTHTAGTIWWTQLRCNKKASADLIVDGAITADKITANAITTAKIAADAITTDKIAASAITATEIASDAVTTAKIAAGAVTASEIAANTITAGQIASGAITTDELAAGAVTATKIAAGTITANEIAASTITGSKIAATTITGANLVADTITSTQIAANAITASELNAGAVTTAKIAAGAVTANELAANSVIAGKISAGAITATEIAANAITASKLVVSDTSSIVPDNDMQDSSAWTTATAWVTAPTTSWRSGKIARLDGDGAAYTILNSKVFTVEPGQKYYAAGQIQRLAGTGSVVCDLMVSATSDMASPSYLSIGNTTSTSLVNVENMVTVPAGYRYMRMRFYKSNNGTTSCYGGGPIVRRATSAELIVDGTITGTKIAAGTITASNIAADTITASQIAANAITASELNAGAVTTAKIAAGAVTANEIAANTITAGQIATGAINADEIAAGAVRTDKLLVTGKGKALNDDPFFSDASAWTFGSGVGSYAIVADSTSPSGAYVLRATNGVQFKARSFPIAAGTRYKVSMWARQTSGAGGMYLRLYCYNSAGTNINNVVTNLTGGTIENIDVPVGWTKYTGYIDSGAATVTGILIVHVNWNTTGVTDVADCRVEEYIGADLIVDGAISATKIATDAVTADKILANSITGGKIAASTITGSNIAGTTITAGNLAANAITADKINTGAVTAGKVAAGAINATNIIADGVVTAAKVNANGLSVKNASGTVLLAANGDSVPPWVVAVDAAGTGTSLVEESNNATNTAQLRTIAVGKGLSLTQASGTVTIGSTSPTNVIYLVSDQTFTSTTLSHVDGFYLPLEANKTYMVRAVVRMKTPVATTGVRVGCEVPYHATSGGAKTTFSATAQTAATTSQTQVSYTDVGGGMAGYFTSSWGEMNTVYQSFNAAAYTNVILESLVITGSIPGKYQIIAGTEIAASTVTVGAGSYLSVQEIATASTPSAVTLASAPAGLAASYSASDYDAYSSASATVTVTIKTDGTWSVARTNNSLITGTWLSSGSASGFDVLFDVTATSGTTGISRSNSASSYQQITTNMSYSITATSVRYSGDFNSGSSTIAVRFKNRGNGAVTTMQTITLSVDAEADYYGGIIP